MARSKLHVLLTYHHATPATHIRQLVPLGRLAARGELTFEEREANRVTDRTLRAADIVLLQRLEHPKEYRFLRQARELGKLVVYDTDDNWITGPPAYHPAYESYQSTLIRSTVERFLRQADRVTVSTPALARAFAAYNEHLSVLPNTIDLEAVPPPSGKPLDRITIGYSGTRTHEGDFEHVIPALVRLQKKYGQRLRLVFLGFVPRAARQAGLEFEELGFQDDYVSYLRTLARCGIDIGLAPLLENEFNSYKSPIKYLEYGAISAAGVYSDGPAFQGTVADGRTGLLVGQDSNAWFAALDRLLANDDLRSRLGQSAKADVEEHHGVEGSCKAWMKVFRRPNEEPALRSRPSSRSRKKIFYIGAGMLWPHTYIDEMLVRAFSQTGAEVVYWPIYPPKLFSQLCVLWDRFEERHRRRLAEEGFAVDRTLLKIKEEAPDLIFAIQGYVLPRDILQQLRGLGFPSAVWMMDEPYDTARSSRIGEFFDHVFLQDSATVDDHRNHGNPNVHFLPHGCDAAGFHEPMSSPVKKWDISVVGSGFPYRRQLFEAVAGSPKSLLAGTGWDGLEGATRVEIRPPVAFDEAARIYRGTRINLMIHRRETEQGYGRSTSSARTPNGSVFYAAGCGAFQLVDDSRPDLESFFEPGKEIVTFHDEKELREKVEYYLSHEEDRLRISEAGVRRAHSEHSYRRRVEQILETVETPPIEHHPRVAEQTVFVPGALDPESRSALDGARVIEILPGEGSSSGGLLLSGAILEADSPFVIFCSPGAENVVQTIARARAELGRSPDHGAVLALNERAGVVLALFSLRLLWRLGAFDPQFESMEEALRDRALSMEMQGFRYAVIEGCGASFGELLDRHAGERTSSSGVFEKKWGADPEARLDSRMLLTTCKVFEEWDDLPTSRNLVEKAVALDPQWAQARKRHGQVLFRLGYVKEAMREIELAWENDPADAEAGLLYALGTMAAGKLDKALDVLLACEKLEMPWPTRASVQGGIGRCLRRLGRIDEALARFRRALTYDPVYADAYREMASCYGEQQHQGDALECIIKAAAIKPRDPAIQAERARILQLLGRQEEARKVLAGAKALLAAGGRP